MANQFELRGHHIEVHYTIGGNPGFTALTYKDEFISRAFKPGDIHTDHTALGSLVSVRLVERSTDNYTVFAFLLPEIEVPPDQTGDFTTVGIHQEYKGKGSVSIPYSPLSIPTTWHPFVMHGTAKNVVVAL
ncbi:hypothetical protein [Nitrosovibrio tenuis]|uniref:Uncharacterized protein n=1 Tax=Nitrosovibrio tenuis TaxID=1233 RepID=A0A1H7NLY5_9PROT|nr:hypothetical protein [Nitrosovibrio tenuis]SEL24005.1 hypothetical protein SAMN05216387_10753 [Nitrosovibrio tenuis]